MSKHLKTILEKIEQGNTQQEIAEQLGISQAAVSLAIKRMFSRIKFCPHCHKPIVDEKDKKTHCVHIYSRALEQEYPRKCLDCGYIEGDSHDN